MSHFGDYCPVCGKLNTECTEHETQRDQRLMYTFKHDCMKCGALNTSRDSYCPYCGLEMWQSNEVLLANPETRERTERFIAKNDKARARLLVQHPTAPAQSDDGSAR